MPVILASQMLLDEARAAYHRLVTGISARELVDQNGERVTFTAANRADLYNYIQQLQAQLEPVAVPAYGPARFIF